MSNSEGINYINRSSTGDLYRLCDKLRISHEVFISNRVLLPSALDNPHIRFIILNLDPGLTGTHWVALDKKKKVYFDSYAQRPPNGVPDYYTRASTNKELQSIDSSICGQLCVLWIYYMKHKSNDEYYRLFKDVY
jgi:hypothetical protein